MAQGTLPGFISALRAELRPVAIRNVLRASRAHPSSPFSYISRFIDSPFSSFLMLFQIKILLVGRDDRVHDGSPEACFLQCPDALDGGAAGRADGVLQGAGMFAAFQNQPGGPISTWPTSKAM